MLTSIIIVITYLFLQMCLVWVLYRVYNNPSIVDSSWSIGLMISGLIYLFSTEKSMRTIIIAFLLILWALRLAGYLWLTRLLQGHKDKRYFLISNQWKINQSFGFFLNFQFQAFLILLISPVFLLIAHTRPSTFSWLDSFALILCIIGILGESLADLQLQRFKKTHYKKVCNVGLWRYSRHPNYFFDWLTWLGFALFALQANFGWLSLFSVALLYVIFTWITGPITETASLQSRGSAYKQYQETTSMFIPWFKLKKIDSE